MKTRWSSPPVLIALALARLSLGAVQAEHYLSVPEAQKVCFPNAGRFDPQTTRLNSEQIKTVQRKSAVKVRDPVLRFRVARQDTNTLGVLMIDQVLGKHELIDYAVAISPQGRVLRVELLEYRENYGDAVHNLKWRDQFKGKTAASKLKLNDDIYNISGATISCRNVTEGVRRVLATFELVVGPRLGLIDRLPVSSPKP